MLMDFSLDAWGHSQLKETLTIGSCKPQPQIYVQYEHPVWIHSNQRNVGL